MHSSLCFCSFIEAPGSPSVKVEIHATSIKVWWSKPAEDGGSPITAYRVLILQEKKIAKNVNITNLSTKDRDFGDLTTSTNYTLRVFARNYVFEGNATEKKIQTKFQGKKLCSFLKLFIYSVCPWILVSNTKQLQNLTLHILLCQPDYAGYFECIS